MSNEAQVFIKEYGIKRYVALRSYLKVHDIYMIISNLSLWHYDSLDLDQYGVVASNRKLCTHLGSFFSDKYYD